MAATNAGPSRLLGAQARRRVAAIVSTRVAVLGVEREGAMLVLDSDAGGAASNGLTACIEGVGGREEKGVAVDPAKWDETFVSAATIFPSLPFASSEPASPVSPPRASPFAPATWVGSAVTGKGGDGAADGVGVGLGLDSSASILVLR